MMRRMWVAILLLALGAGGTLWPRNQGTAPDDHPGKGMSFEARKMELLRRDELLRGCRGPEDVARLLELGWTPGRRDVMGQIGAEGNHHHAGKKSKAEEVEHLLSTRIESLGTSQIRGRVTDAHGVGIAGVTVYIYGQVNNSFAYADTDEQGDYALTDIDADQYHIRFSAFSAGNYMSEWYNRKASEEEADTVTVGEAQTLEHVDAALTTGGMIQGRVLNEGGSPLYGVYVNLYDSDGYWSDGVRTDDEGRYAFIRMGTGSYKVEFEAEGYADDYLGEWYNDKQDRESADSISVVLGETTSGIDGMLAPAGKICGRVTDEAGEGIGNVAVMVQTPDGKTRRTSTDHDGVYTLGSLGVAGSYEVSFAHPDYVGEYYDNKSDAADASPVTVVVGQTSDHVDASLALAGHLSGRVTNDAGEGIDWVTVRLYDSQGGILTSVTENSGYYTIDSVPPGNCRVGFDTTWADEYAREWYDDKGSLAAAQPIAITAGQTTENINAQLGPAGTLSGRVVQADGTGMDHVAVLLYDPDDRTEASAVAFTDPDGRYTFGGLCTSTHKVYLLPISQNGAYALQWYHDTLLFSLAQVVSVSAGQATSGIDFTLRPAGSITGTVRNEQGAGIADVVVTAFNRDTQERICTCRTDGNGEYSIAYLPQGQYKIFFDTATHTLPYQEEWYDDQGGHSSAGVVSVVAGSSTGGINAVLAPAAGQSLVLTAPNGGEKLRAGASCAITWNSTGIRGDLVIELLREGAVAGVIASRVAASAGSFAWVVGHLEGGARARGSGWTIRIRTLDGSASATAGVPPRAGGTDRGH